MTHECMLFDKEIDFSNISIVQGLMLGFCCLTVKIKKCSCSRATFLEFVIVIFKG